MALDYGIIFLIIIVIIIVIAIILIIYANRGNVQNLLLTLPNYRIQDVTTGGYLGLVNLPGYETNQVPIYLLSDNPFIPFWNPFVTTDSSANDPLGLWKIDIITQIRVDVAEVRIVNDVYFTETIGAQNTLGYLALGPADQENFSPANTLGSAVTFIMTTIAPNTFTLVLKDGNFPVIVNKTNDFTNNLLNRAFNVNVKPVTLRLTLV